MYTGITRGLFTVTAVERQPELLTYTVQLSAALATGLELGNSVSIDGVCQTVVALDDDKVTFNAIAETLRKTTLATLKMGQQVSVERSARLGDELGGHALAGHVFETGTIAQRSEQEHDVMLTIKCSAQCMQYIFTKGYVGIDGSSLTVGDVDVNASTFNLHLIPATLDITNFKTKQVGDKVNIELDPQAVMVVQTIARRLASLETRITTLEQTKN